MLQAQYVAESINISGLPINIYPLLGVHEQGTGSLLPNGSIIGSSSAPGFPLTNINVAGAYWASSQVGTAVINTAWVGFDFGIKTIVAWSNQSEYDPPAPKLTEVGSINITQSNNPANWAQQIKVETTTGHCTYCAPTFVGTGNGAMVVNGLSPHTTKGVVTAFAINALQFQVLATLPNGSTIPLGVASVNTPFNSLFINFTITSGTTPFAMGDAFTVVVDYIWKRQGIYNLIQSPSPQTLNFQSLLKVKAVKVTPTLFTGSGSWQVAAFDILDQVPTNINNIQDLFLNENRDRDYALAPLPMKVAYTPTDSITDLSRFGLNLLDQYTFTCSFVTMIQTLGRPIMVGDILEVTNELQYDQNLLPVRRFLEVTDAGWYSGGFSTLYLPTVYRFTAQQAMPAQETRDIFGTLDTQKYLIADSIFTDGVGAQVDTTPLTETEQIIENALDAVPQTGDDTNRSIQGTPKPKKKPARNTKGNPEAGDTGAYPPNLYIADGLPKDGAPYTEGFKLPDITPALKDGTYFRLYYPPETQIQPALYRFSIIKNRWILMERDQRAKYSSLKPSLQQIFQSPTKEPMDQKQT
jgi:hypothetical protein